MSIITGPRLNRLWQDAQIKPEWAVNRLWEYLFNHVFFKEDSFILRRVDLVVEMMDSRATTMGIMLVLQEQRVNILHSMTEEVEYRVFAAACAFHVATGLEHIWIMTCVHTAARLCIFSASSEFLIPFVPSDVGWGIPKDQCLESSTHGREILEGLESLRPVSATLPANWHDNEVTQLDARRRRANVEEGVSD
ncbi:hypothetical protein C7999DRAFT_44605 [Corynascus novoguineensis]|uniref:Uncharacterized protein n=1 Tax=Corynascus novoguineensis TaxID=1126955 RepID=A0AAN7HKQ4_9PEZI|nr:hypothetical protein C7999DRAFT_44605 [Corynascus novoguineensis]